MNADVVFSFLLASMVLTISPGPDILYVISQSISNGRKYGIITALGLVSGVLVHTAWVALGVSAVLKQSDILFLLIKVAGALYLVRLAYLVYQSDTNIELSAGEEKKPLGKLFKRGFVMNILNPKVTLFFLAFFPGFVRPEAGHTTGQVFVLGILFMIQAFLIFSSVALVADRLTVFLRENQRFILVLKWLQIVAFVAIALLILL